jgi:hypothetical protein
MRHSLIWIITLLALLTPADTSFGQYGPYSPPAWPRPDPRLQRYWRDQAVAYAGGSPQARNLVEAYGEAATAALLFCSPRVARQLVAFCDAGGLDKLHRPKELLTVIGQPSHGDDVCLFILTNADQLAEADACDVFLMSPLEFSLSLKSLSTEVDAVRAYRQSAQAGRQSGAGQITLDPRTIAVGGGALALVLLIWWRRSRQVA